MARGDVVVFNESKAYLQEEDDAILAIMTMVLMEAA